MKKFFVIDSFQNLQEIVEFEASFLPKYTLNTKKKQEIVSKIAHVKARLGNFQQEYVREFESPTNFLLYWTKRISVLDQKETFNPFFTFENRWS